MCILEIQSLWPDWPLPFFTVPTPKFFDQLLLKENLYEHAKNQATSLICSKDMVDSKILHLTGSEHFGPYLKNKNVPKYGICARTLQIIYIFIIDQIH